jgi:Ni/Co efflux regulator RcnB
MKRLLLTVTAFAVLAMPMAALADPGHGKDHKGKKSHTYSHRQPPGLAKKPHGMPPGQAKKMWNRGDRLPPTYISQRYYVSDPYRYELSPAPYGYRWVRVGDHFYLAQTQTGLITQVITSLLR